MEQSTKGYWNKSLKNLSEGTLYKYIINDSNEEPFPDPASFFQPEGVHGPSAIVNHLNYNWTDQSYQSVPLKDMIIYELHVGTFTEDGTFEGIINKLDYLKEIGINTIELMPVNQFPGERNWGYDGVFNYAVQNSYGGPDKLKKLVDQVHKRGMAILLDVVYNHLGPEGNYLGKFGPYFNDKYKTIWGPALNFDDAYSDEVRNFYIENALYWFEQFHFDGLRLDAIHAIGDESAKHILKEIRDEVRKLEQKKGRRFLLIAESNLNDVKILNSANKGGYDLDGQWSDDFHHVVHTLLTGENSGYYMDYGRFSQLKKAMEDGYVYMWEYSPFRKKKYGSYIGDIERHRLVTFIQSHDQIGNRMNGERLSHLISPSALKVAVGLLFTSLNTPMLFMGEEYAVDSPFLYFVHHSDQQLIDAVKKGRQEEFKDSITADAPNPQALETFKKSKLDWNLLNQEKNRKILHYYKTLINLRKENTAFQKAGHKHLKVWEYPEKNVLIYNISSNDDNSILMVANLSSRKQEGFNIPDELDGKYIKILDSFSNNFNFPEELETATDKISASSPLGIGPYNFLIYKSSSSLPNTAN